MVAQTIHDASSDKAKDWVDLDDKTKKHKIKNIKHRLCHDAVNKMTKERVENWDNKNEITGWLNEIKSRLQ